MAPILLPIPYMATHKPGNKETSNNQRQKKNEMKAKPMDFLTRQFFKDYSTIKAMKRTQKQARTQRET